MAKAAGPRGSSSADTVTREGFLGTTAAIVAAAFASEFLTVPRGPPSYDVSKYERIFDTSRKSFLPADPTRLILPGGGFSDRVVCAGEMHTHPLHHRMQFEVIKALSGVTKSRGEPLAVGLEMFYRQQQVCAFGLGCRVRVPPRRPLRPSVSLSLTECHFFKSSDLSQAIVVVTC